MSFEVYDFRQDKDIRNLLVTPQIRARFARMEPGEEAGYHSHDLGHEVFLVLQGRALFTIDGDEKELGPGEMCVALVDQVHKVRAVGDEPMVMYLSVTPHLQPTHTSRSETGERHPHHFPPSSSYDVVADPATSVESLIDRHLAATEAAGEAAQASAQVQRHQSTQLRAALAAGDKDAAHRAGLAMAAAHDRTMRLLYEMADTWNDLAPHAG